MILPHHVTWPNNLLGCSFPRFWGFLKRLVMLLAHVRTSRQLQLLAKQKNDLQSRDSNQPVSALSSIVYGEEFFVSPVQGRCVKPTSRVAYHWSTGSVLRSWRYWDGWPSWSSQHPCLHFGLKYYSALIQIHSPYIQTSTIICLSAAFTNFSLQVKLY